MRRRRSLAAVAGAVLGLGALLLVTPRLPWRASPGQLPGYAAARGFDPGAGALRLALFALLPLCGGAAAWRLTRPRRQPDPSRWAVAPRRPRLLGPAAVAHALAAWAFLVPFAMRWVGPLTLLVVLLLASLALATVLGRGDSEEGAAYLGAAAAILPFAFLGTRPPTVWLAVGLAGYALPPLARLCAAVLPGIVRVARVMTLAVLLPGSVTALAAAACMRLPRVVDVFEDGSLAPASCLLLTAYCLLPPGYFGTSVNWSCDPTVTFSFAAIPPAISSTWRAGPSGP